MPKNTTGGKGHKKQASKGANFVQRDYKITSPLEVEGYVDKILGNGMLLVNSTNDLALFFIWLDSHFLYIFTNILAQNSSRRIPS